AFAATDPGLLLAAASADELVRDGAAAPAVVVLGDGPRAAAAAVAAAAAGVIAVALLGDPGTALNPDDSGDLGPAATIFATTDDDALRAWLKPRAGSGRADLALAGDGQLVRAARLVRRGGAIASLASERPDAGPRPSITTLVQRELELRAPRDLVRGA